MEEVSINEDQGYTFLGFRCGYSLLWRFAGRGSLYDISEVNAEIMEEI